MTYALCLMALAALVVLWCTVPALWVLSLPDVPMAHRRAAALSFGRASVRGLRMLPIDLLAPFVVPIALLQTRREDNALPRWARWWDNDVSINGDGYAVLRGGVWVQVQGNERPGERVFSYDNPEYRGDAY